MTTISIIVAAAQNNVIGFLNRIPWHIPEDFKHFKNVTMGKPCIMGRKTYESILDQLGTPLPGRESLVVTKSGYTHEGCTSFDSLEAALDAAKEKTNDEVMIIGGAQIYAKALEKNLVDRIHMTRIHQKPLGDAYFPALKPEWSIFTYIDKDGYSFQVLQKKNR